MFNRLNFQKRPNYFLTKFQNEIYRQVKSYMESKTPNLTQTDIANKLGVSNSYVSQILNGNFNFTLKKLIELGLMIGKVPELHFVDFEQYWKKREFEPSVSIQQSI